MKKSSNAYSEDGFTFEKHQGDRIDIRTNSLGDELTISIYKPGRFYVDGKGYAKCPVMKFELEGSMLFNIYLHESVKRAVSSAISALNRERKGTINTSQFNDFSMGFIDEQVVYYGNDKK